jgi:hypothetical protein
MMQKRVFVSYSSKDQIRADAICAALEAAGIPCWIAPRDLEAGAQWGAGIVQAIEACEAMVVVFSAAANGSPQIARELQLAVSNRRALIPIRIEDAAPTEDMEYFLGVSHWFNAYPAPLETYLPEIVASVNRVLTAESGAWRSFRRRLPKTPVLAIGGGVVGAFAVALLVANLMRPPGFQAVKSPLRGRWETEVATDTPGGKMKCVVDVQDTGQATYADTCPPPLMGTSVSVAIAKDGTWAPAVYHAGEDDGTFLLQGGSAHGFAGAYRVRGGKLVTRDAAFGEVTWHKDSSRKPMHSEVADILPPSADWPAKDTPGMARSATKYIRSRWKADAVLMSMKLELQSGNNSSLGGLKTPAGPVQVTFEFYSPSTQEGMYLNPTLPGLTMSPEGVIDRNPAEALPEAFIDLPAAVAVMKSRGMRAQQIKQAELENWGVRPPTAWCGSQGWPGLSTAPWTSASPSRPFPEASAQTQARALRSAMYIEARLVSALGRPRSLGLSGARLGSARQSRVWAVPPGRRWGSLGTARTTSQRLAM